jgi:hypothetical protein
MRGSFRPWRLIGLALLAWLLWRVDWPALGRALAGARWELVVAAALLNLPLLLLKALRWRSVLRLQGIDLPVGPSLAYYLASLYWAFLTPGRVGELARVAYLRGNHQVPAALALAGVVADRLLDLYALLWAAAVGLAWGVYPAWRAPAGVAVAGLVLAPALLALAAHRRPAAGAVPRQEGVRWPRLRARLGELGRGLTVLWQPGLWRALLLTAASYLVFFTQAWLLTAALGLGLRWGEVAPVVAVTNMAAYLPVSVSGLGTREGCLWLMLSPLGVGLAQVLALSLTMVLVFYLVSGVLGAAAWWRHPVPLRWLRQGGEPAEGESACSPEHD